MIEEIEAISDEIKRNQILDLIKDFEKLNSKGEEIELLTEEYVKSGIIPVKHIEDAVHIAVATVFSLDALVSWNFEHIVKLKTKGKLTLLTYYQATINWRLLSQPCSKKGGVIEMSYFSEFYKIEVREEIAKEFTNSRGEVDDMMAGLHEIRVRKAEKNII